MLNVNKSWTEDERSGRSLKGSSDSRPMAAIEAPRAQRSLYCAVVALRRRPSEDANDPVDLPPAVPDEVIRVLSVLPSASIVTAPNGDVLRASARALSLGLVNRNSLAVPDVSRLVERVADDGEAREQEMRVRRPPLGRELLELRVRVAPLGTGVLLVLVDDLAEERRVDAVRRDFVANVSHELKTPVGALSLLAETVLSAADDPEQVRHFAERMQTEASRLASLIQDVIDLSRLQGDDPMIRAAAVDLDELITSAFDEVRTLATSRNIELVRSGEADSELYGDRGQLLTAVRNLLSNAVVYSPPGTRVAVSCASRQGVAEIAVKDQGIGIPGHDLDRIFERFYRVDQARSRSTGGTGLGLSIVKHVCQNHGGECTVWSEVGTGSTFTLRLPVYDPQTDMQRQAHELDIDVVTTPEQGGSS